MFHLGFYRGEKIEMQPDHTIEESTIRDYVRVIFRHKLLFIILPIAILIPTYTSQELIIPTYRASVREPSSIIVWVISPLWTDVVTSST